MSWRHKFSGILLIFTSCLLDSFTTSFPIWTSFLEPDPDPEYGPFFQGDIIDNPWDRNGIPGQRYRWPKGIFKYHVSDDYSFVEMEHIYTAVLILVTETCLVDEELLISEETVDHVYYSREKKYCASSIGRRGKRQNLWLGQYCFHHSMGVPLHETLHAVGFYHEQCRTDRDDYVTINLTNIWKDYQRNFDKVPSNAYETPYDYLSILHYSAYAFAIDKNVKTIVTRDTNAQIGQRIFISGQDVRKVNQMYKDECASRLAAEALENYPS